ncbi:hypothetical protein [Dyadobacter aurulentus]|uniref:hypothetical protein n=1 Tax=Dyadobacter sp. UC 10 TaxID=2605428 RepID=UPI0011F3811A|nr:hypothetical protein [Dyadobacter sp. UC 10]KAA0992949.1 hypothetical protein FXO21_23655 [Dyadobacter sp. UC 10]
MKELSEALTAWQYARANNINPADPDTWDDEYKRIQQRLAGIKPIAKTQVTLLREWLDSFPE